MPFTGQMAICKRDGGGCIFIDAEQSSFAATPPPRHFLWFDWEEELELPGPRLGTEALVEAIEPVILDAIHRYHEKTGNQATHITFQTPLRILGQMYRRQPDGSTRRLCGLTVLQDLKLGLGECGLSAPESALRTGNE